MFLFVHRPSGADTRKHCASGQGGRAIGGSVIRCQTRPGGHCDGRRASATVVGLRVRVGRWRERRRERRRDRADGPAAGQRYRVHSERRPRPAVIVASTGPGHGLGHGGGAAATGLGGQVVLPAQPHTGSTQRRDGHHQRQRAGVPVDSRRRARGWRRAGPAQRTHG